MPKSPIRAVGQIKFASKLTYMSIRYILQEWVGSGDLRVVHPALESDPTVRYMFATPPIIDSLHGPWDSIRDERRFAQARATIDAYISGQLLSVRTPPSKNVNAQFALLEEASEAVWEIRIREPKPGLRIFGQFCEKDIFIAFNWSSKEELLEEHGYLRAKEDCKRYWRRLFPAYKPYKGLSADDYISNAFSR